MGNTLYGFGLGFFLTATILNIYGFFKVLEPNDKIHKIGFCGEEQYVKIIKFTKEEYEEQQKSEH